jgi:hypothetical protein
MSRPTTLVTTYLGNRRIEPIDFRILVEFVRDADRLEKTAAAFLCAPDAENGPAPRDVDDGFAASVWAKQTRQRLAVALLSRDADTLGTDDLDLIVAAVEELEHAEGRHYASLVNVLHAIAADAHRREESEWGRRPRPRRSLPRRRRRVPQVRRDVGARSERPPLQRPRRRREPPRGDPRRDRVW